MSGERFGLVSRQGLSKAPSDVVSGVVLDNDRYARRDEQLEAALGAIVLQRREWEPLSCARSNDRRDRVGDPAGVFIRQPDPALPVVEVRHGRSVVGRLRASLPVYGPAIKQALDESTATRGALELV